jgi:hypothetical protein
MESQSKLPSISPILDSTADPAPQPSLTVNIPIRRPEKKEATEVPSKEAPPKEDEIVIGKSKMELFLEEYLRNGGNGTQAALKVFNTKSKVNAASMARQYLKRAAATNQVLLEKKGYSYGKMLDEAISKMKSSKTPEWWDRLMKIGGYEDFMSKGPVTKQTVNIMQVQKDMLDEYVDGEYVGDTE